MAKKKYKDAEAARKARVFLVLMMVFFLSLCVWGTVRIVKGIAFDINCAAYIKRAAVANTVDLAQAQLEKAIDFAEANDLTHGIVSIFLQNPSNDIEFWFQNMTVAYEELANMPEEASQLERTNVLMKLRESLTDSGDTGSSVNIPDGISIYPHNAVFFWWAMISILGAALFFVLWTAAYEKAIGRPIVTTAPTKVTLVEK